MERKGDKKRVRKRERIQAILAALETRYPHEDKCYLNYSQPHELLIATILSAQCTDDRVNIVTRELFVKYPTLEAFAAASLAEMEMDVRPTGFYRNKAKNIISTARHLLEKFDGIMPSSVEELTSLAGVGRKTANVVRCHIFKLPSVVVDTHVMRISKRLGLTKKQRPNKNRAGPNERPAQKQLDKIQPPNNSLWPRNLQSPAGKM